ncbi:ABC transporter permease [Anaerofilum sp. BX8]|uniref:ABC transporter permease n=1 Tax=Anaerofilum hominis TaxID=2763016 RepID=A0A923IE57_9FIRM|nr:ABC transporter permease [Anaerofilum hominis]
MGLLDNIRMAFASLWANKMRAVLTMLGIIIGIGSVIAIVTVGDSLTGSISDSMQSLGAGNITVSLSQKSSDDDGEAVMMEGVSIRMFGPSRPADEDLLTDDMIAEYRRAFGDRVAAVSRSESLGSGTVTQKSTSLNVNITGADLDYPAAEGLEITNGRFLNQNDLDGRKKVCVVTDEFAEKLFGERTDPIGKSFEAAVNGKVYTFYIVGVTPYDDGGAVAMFGSDVSYPVYIPLTTAKKLAGSAAGYQSFTVVGSSAGENAQFLSDTESFFASYYTRNQSWTVRASSMESMMSTVTEMISTVQLAIAAIAAISLLVGGIGVMNIMMVSITERTREIGTRKALGAPGYAIRLQFITESVVICLIGGVIGIVLGVILGAWGASLLGYAAKPSLLAVTASVGFSMAIGVFFGSYPASKAAKLDPIEALRYE